ncbi:MAG: hypothetical protein EPN73_02330 [Paraburkholderia sp.]|uniref:hypothetical protein n=1 Tax=Paraburkholderia sp. TaxID=1926495 RepID=UPI00120CBFB4|nr:hypothetical protein [Paraburkholderia sp.]TAL98767.1 MAG: hypothetical protein EPN73_02330 [Paraburkholderia sp.]
MTDLDVPEGFPLDIVPPVVSGAQPKVCARLSNGVYVVGQSDDERLERWLLCEDLARQLVGVAEKDALAHPDRSPSQTLERVEVSVGRKGWVSPDELAWLIRRLRTLLDW